MDWTSSLFKNLSGEVPAGHEDRAAAAVLEAEEVQALAAEAVRAAVKRADHAVSTGAVRADPIAPAIVIQAQVRAVVLVSCLYLDRIEVVHTIAQVIIHTEVQEAVPANVQEVVSAIVQAQAQVVVEAVLAVQGEAVKEAVPVVVQAQEERVKDVVQVLVEATVPEDLGQLTFVGNPSLATLFLPIKDSLKMAIWLNYAYGDDSVQ